MRMKGRRGEWKQEQEEGEEESYGHNMYEPRLAQGAIYVLGI